MRAFVCGCVMECARVIVCKCVNAVFVSVRVCVCVFVCVSVTMYACERAFICMCHCCERVLIGWH